MSTHGAATALNREPLGVFMFIFDYTIFCLPVHENYKHYLVWDHVVTDHGEATALNMESLNIFLFIFVYIILCLPFHENYKHDLVLEHVVSDHGAATVLRQKQKLSRKILFKSV